MKIKIGYKFIFLSIGVFLSLALFLGIGYFQAYKQNKQRMLLRQALLL